MKPLVAAASNPAKYLTFTKVACLGRPILRFHRSNLNARSSLAMPRNLDFTPAPVSLRLLTIYHRTIRHPKPLVSAHFRQLRNYPANAKTLGEYVRQKRIDMQLSMSQLAKSMGLEITDSVVEKWEKKLRVRYSEVVCVVGACGFMSTVVGLTSDTGWLRRCVPRRFLPRRPGRRSCGRLSTPGRTPGRSN